MKQNTSAQRTSVTSNQRVAAVPWKMSLQFYSQRARRGWQCRRSVRKNRRRTRKNVVDVYASTGGDRRGKVRLVGDGDVHFATGVVVVENSLLVWNWNWVLDWICSLWIWLWIWIWICCSSYRQQRTRRSPGGHTRLPNVCNRFLLIRDFQRRGHTASSDNVVYVRPLLILHELCHVPDEIDSPV